MAYTSHRQRKSPSLLQIITAGCGLPSTPHGDKDSAMAARILHGRRPSGNAQKDTAAIKATVDAAHEAYLKASSEQVSILLAAGASVVS